jgi:pyruvate kinase
VISLSVEGALDAVDVAAIFVPTFSGATARSIARRRPDVWIVAASPSPETVRRLQLTRGVFPILVEEKPRDWRVFAKEWLAAHDIPDGVVILTEGPSPANPDRTHRLEILDTRE